MLVVKKEGINKGREFYVCSKPANQQCKFFKWADQVSTGSESRGITYQSQYIKPKPLYERRAFGSKSESSRSQEFGSAGNGQTTAVAGNTVFCDCGLPAKKLVVAKEGRNKGREFYVCPKPFNQQCKFYKWADQVSYGTGPRVTTKYQRMDLPSTERTGSTVLCNCGLPAKKLVVLKQGINKGREFYVCPKPMNQQCRFYQWADQIPSGTPSRIASNQPVYKMTNSPLYEGKDNTVRCNCGLPAKKLVVVKQGINKGREFYVCPKPMYQQCKFYQWADTLPPFQTGPIRTSNQPVYTTHLPFQEERGDAPKTIFEENLLSLAESKEIDEHIKDIKEPDDDPKTKALTNLFSSWSSSLESKERTPDNTAYCNCGLPAKKLVVLKQGINKGREFYVCPKPMNQQCKFYQWADTLPPFPSASMETSNQPVYKTTDLPFHDIEEVPIHDKNLLIFSSSEESSEDSSESGDKSKSKSKENLYSWPSLESKEDNKTSGENPRICDCGLPARKYIVSKDTENKGRAYYACPKPAQDRCSYFRWAEGAKKNVTKTPRKRKPHTKASSESINTEETEFLEEQVILSDESYDNSQENNPLMSSNKEAES